MKDVWKKSQPRTPFKHTMIPEHLGEQITSAISFTDNAMGMTTGTTYANAPTGGVTLTGHQLVNLMAAETNR